MNLLQTEKFDFPFERRCIAIAQRRASVDHGAHPPTAELCPPLRGGQIGSGSRGHRADRCEPVSSGGSSSGATRISAAQHSAQHNGLPVSAWAEETAHRKSPQVCGPLPARAQRSVRRCVRDHTIPEVHDVPAGRCSARRPSSAPMPRTRKPPRDRLTRCGPCPTSATGSPLPARASPRRAVLRLAQRHLRCADPRFTRRTS